MAWRGRLSVRSITTLASESSLERRASVLGRWVGGSVREREERWVNRVGGWVGGEEERTWVGKGPPGRFLAELEGLGGQVTEGGDGGGGSKSA